MINSYQWLPDGTGLSAIESPDLGSAAQIASYDFSSGRRRVLLDVNFLREATDGATILRHAWADTSQHLLVSGHMIDGTERSWIINCEEKSSRRFHHDNIQNPCFSPNGQFIAYIFSNDIWIESVLSGALSRATFDGSEVTLNGIVDWSIESSFEVGPGLVWAPDSKRIAFLRYDLTAVGTHSLRESFGASSPRIRMFPYPEPGGHIPTGEVGLFEIASGELSYFDLQWDPGVAYLPRLKWHAGGERVFVQAVNRQQNRSAVLSIDLSSRRTCIVVEDHDVAWVEASDFFVRPDGSCVVTSERDGWRRLYHVRAATHWRPLTPSGFDINAVRYISRELDEIYIEASPEEPARNYLYRISPSGAGPVAERVTPSLVIGWNNYDIAPCGRWAYHTHSSLVEPPVVEIIELPSHRVTSLLPVKCRRSKVSGLCTEFFKVSILPDVELDAYMMRPSNFDPARKYPLLLYVYGGPAKATVRDEWSDYLAKFHQDLVRDGFLVLSVENRGTPAPKGRNWRKAVRGQQDVLPFREQAAAIREILKTRPYIDPFRMAVWGHSAGGSATLHLMFREPSLFKVGIASAAVVDRRYYCAPFQERFLGLPELNEESYFEGSNINFADGLSGHLLLIHGAADTNVHPKMTEMLSDRLIELGKVFYCMIYPGRGHGLPRDDPDHYYKTIRDFILRAIPL